MKLNATLFSLAALAVAACGGSKADFAPISIPETEIVDVSKIPAGDYKLVKIQSSSSVAEKNVLSNFTHVLTKPGDPEANDEVQKEIRKGDTGDEVLQLTVELNLPYQMKAESSTVKFDANHYYWHYTRTNDDWRWYASGGEKSDGLKFHELFISGTRESDAKPIYSGTISSFSMRGAVQVEGDLVRFFFERSQSNSAGAVKQVVVVTYRKQ